MQEIGLLIAKNICGIDKYGNNWSETYQEVYIQWEVYLSND